MRLLQSKISNPKWYETLAILKILAVSDNASVVRQVAIYVLARGWKDEPGMFEFWRDRALNGSFEREHDWEDNFRQTTVETIIEHYPNHPQVRSLLRDRVEIEPDEQVRDFARKELEKFNRQN